MFKKFLLPLTVVFSFVLFFTFSKAEFNPVLENNCQFNTYDARETVVSPEDLSGNIPICLKFKVIENNIWTGPGSVDVYKDKIDENAYNLAFHFQNDGGNDFSSSVGDPDNNNGITIKKEAGVGGDGFFSVIFNYYKDYNSSANISTILNEGKITETFVVDAYDIDGNSISLPGATINFFFSIPKPVITITDTTNGKGVLDGDSSSVKVGDNISISCSNGTELYVDSERIGYTGTNYNLSKSIQGITAGSHKAACHNIGNNGSATTHTDYYPEIDFTVKETMTGNITPDYPTCIIADGANSCTLDITWSTTNPIGTSAITSNTDKYGNVYTQEQQDSGVNQLPNTNTNSGTQKVTIPYSNRKFYLYNNATELDQVTAIASCNTANGSSWSDSKGMCVPATVCPSGATGTYPNCVCNTGTYDLNTNSCIQTACPSSISTGTYPNCTCNNSNKVFNSSTMSCNCPAGSPTGTYADSNTCGCLPNYNLVNGTCQPKPVVNSFSHFLIFNVSASNVQKGSSVTLSWTIQDPTSTCSIKATDLNGADISSLNSQIGNKQIKTPNFTSSSKNIAIDSIVLQINQSTRFIASCDNSYSNYNPGVYTLKRDVYVTGESETR